MESLSSPDQLPPPQVTALQVKVAGRVLDVSSAVPLTLGDMEALETHADPECRVTLKQFGEQDFRWRQMAAIAWAAVRKVDPSITLQDMVSMPLPTLNRLVKWAISDGEVSPSI